MFSSGRFLRAAKTLIWADFLVALGISASEKISLVCCPTNGALVKLPLSGSDLGFSGSRVNHTGPEGIGCFPRTG